MMSAGDLENFELHGVDDAGVSVDFHATDRALDEGVQGEDAENRLRGSGEADFPEVSDRPSGGDRGKVAIDECELVTVAHFVKNLEQVTVEYGIDSSEHSVVPFLRRPRGALWTIPVFTPQFC